MVFVLSGRNSEQKYKTKKLVEFPKYLHIINMVRLNGVRVVSFGHAQLDWMSIFLSAHDHIKSNEIHLVLSKELIG